MRKTLFILFSLCLWKDSYGFIASLSNNFIKNTEKGSKFLFNGITTSLRASNKRIATDAESCEKTLLQILRSDEMKGRGAKSSIETVKTIESLISELEAIGATKNAQNPPINNRILDGCWKLLYTSSPGTNSPIQRTFTAIDQGVNVYQIVDVIDPGNNNVARTSTESNIPEVSNTICFGSNVRLRITALASTSNNPTIKPRENDGKIFGLNIFGVSSTKPPRDPRERIDFAFQDAKFEFKEFPSVAIPYPVPFKLLGDEAKGWIDITYLSSKFRISRGNKGTIFLLEKVDDFTVDPIASLAASNFRASVRDKTIVASKPSKSKESLTTEISTLNQMKLRTSETDSFMGRLKRYFGLPVNPSYRNNIPKQSSKSIIIFPAQLGTGDDYADFIEELISIKNDYDGRIYPAELSRLDWITGLLPSFFSSDYIRGSLKPNPTLKFYYDKVDNAVKKALQNDPDTELIIVAHSIGGWIARAWLSEWIESDIKSRVRSLITLGSPHNPPTKSSFVSTIDQTRGLLSYINNNYPGAYEKQVNYSSVIGSSVQGDFNILKIDSILAYSSYAALGGDGASLGDGIIPLRVAALDGAKNIIIEDIKHSNYLPFPGKSIKFPELSWYGSREAMKKWLLETGVI